MVQINVREHRRDNHKNGQSRETGNIGYTRHRTKINKTKSIIPYASKHKLDVLSNKQEERMCFFYITWSSWLLTVIRRVSLVEPELLTLPENLCGHSCFSDVRVCSIFSFLHSVFLDRCLSFFPVVSNYCVDCYSIYPFWYLTFSNLSYLYTCSILFRFWKTKQKIVW